MKKFMAIAMLALLLIAAGVAQAIPTIGSTNETLVTNLIAGVVSGYMSGDPDVSLGGLLSLNGGATGGLQIPTADIEPGKVVSIDRGELEIRRVPATRVLVGINPNLEAGLGYEDLKLADIVLSGFSLNAKYAFPSTISGTKVAVGANYNKFHVSEAVDKLTSTNIYLAATRPMPGNAKMTANITYTMADFSEMSLSKNNDFVYGLGYEKMFSNGTVAGAELVLSAGDVMSDDFNELNYANLYMNMPINESITGRVGITGIGEYTTTNLGAAVSF